MASDALPRGRHHLTREQVVASQRERMIRGLADAMAEKGYIGTPVADIIQRAGVSRETFYQQFDSKLDCFLAAFDVAEQGLIAVLSEIVGETKEVSPAERYERLFGAYLDLVVAEPAFARLVIVEVFAAGPVAMRRREVLQARVSDLFIDPLDAWDATTRFASSVITAGVANLVSTPLVEDDFDAVRALREPMADLVDRLLRVSRGGAWASGDPTSG
jgi:AcrR family transcriptional regulator